MKLTMLKKIIKEEVKKCLKEDTGRSLEHDLLQKMHNDLGKPNTPPSYDDVFEKSTDVNDSHRGHESGYHSSRKRDIKTSVENYYQLYFPKFYEDMKKLSSN